MMAVFGTRTKYRQSIIKDIEGHFGSRVKIGLNADPSFREQTMLQSKYNLHIPIERILEPAFTHADIFS